MSCSCCCFRPYDDLTISAVRQRLSRARLREEKYWNKWGESKGEAQGPFYDIEAVRDTICELEHELEHR